MPIAYDPTRAALYTPERRETLFVDGATYTPVQIGIEAARLAYYRIEASVAERRRLATDLARASFAELEPFVHPATGSEAFAAVRATDGTALVAFRGTRPDALRDLLTDVRATLTAWPESGGRVHAGFAAAARALLPAVRDWLGRTEHDASRTIFAGHSLGAALATLAASVIANGRLVTLGSPRVGDAAFVASLRVPGVRLVGCCDGVTDLPPALGGYAHAGPRTYLTRFGEQLENPSPDVVSADRLRAHWQYLCEHAWRRGAVLLRSLADHAPINYARVFWP
jgi:hypothetical protein